MIAEYEFDNANEDGDKEAVIVPNAPTLVNKLSAHETNGIKDKINELVEAVNGGAGPVAYPDLRILFKADGNELTTLQIGDIVHGFADATTVWSRARYNGGDPEDRANYTPNFGAVQPLLFTAVATGPNQTFTVPFEAGSVLKSKGELYKGTEWSQVDDQLTIIISINTGNTIYVKP
jgi:hypothetical protein